MVDAGTTLCIGDKVKLQDNLTKRWLCADGFNTTMLMCNDGHADTSCIFEVCCKQSYQQLKSYKKILNQIGIKAQEDLESHQKEEYVDPKDELDLAALSGPGGKLEKEERDNLEEVERQRGQPLAYGSDIQLKHVNSGKFIVLSKEAGLQPGSQRLEVDRDGGEGAWITILPGCRVRMQSEPVAVLDQAKFKMTKKSTQDRQLFIHMNNSQDDNASLDGAYERYVEVNATDQVTQFVILRYQRHDEGDQVLCSGDTLRLEHKEEPGYLTHGQVLTSDSDDVKPRVHILRQEVQNCSNALWELEQMDVTSVRVLTERNNAGQQSEPHELGGNVTWEKLYRLKHKGSGEYLAASFNSSNVSNPTAPKGPVRIYFTSLGKGKVFREGQLETLWALRPVNPKEDMAEPIKLSDPYHIQHAATSYWIHAKTAEGSDQGKYYDDVDPPDDGSSQAIVRTQRMIEMVAERPYADAFGLRKAESAEVLDMHQALRLKPQLEEYTAMLEFLFHDDQHGDDEDSHHPKVPQAEAQNAIDILTSLIKRFLVPYSTDPNPLTRTAPTELSPIIRRRQQLLREQGFLDIIVRMTSAQSPAARGEGKGVPYERLAELEPNVFKVCQLANALVKHIINSNIENCIHMKNIGAIDTYRSQIGFKLEATSVLQMLHKDNMRLLRLLEPSSFASWIQVMKTSIDEEKIEGRLELAVSFLSVTCVCAPETNADQFEQMAIKDNQTAILECLFDDGPMQEMCVAHFEGYGPDIRAKVPLKSKNFPYLFLEDIFTDEKEEGKKRTLEDRAIQQFFIYSIELYANLCKGRNAKAIEKLRILFPKQRVLDMIMEPRERCCDQLRAQFCNLFVRLYIDCDAYPADEDPIELTRVWDEIEQVGRISDLDEEDFEELKHWIYLFLSDELEQKDETLYDCCSHMTSGKYYDGRNSLTLAVIKMVYKMVELRCYYNMVPPKGRGDKEPKASLKDVLKPLLRILDGQTDRTIDVGQEGWSSGDSNRGKQGFPWRFIDTPQNKILTEAKTWICRIFYRVSSLRLNVRMSHLLSQYKEAYLDEKDGEKYIRAGSKFKSMLNQQTGFAILDSKTKKVFEVLDFEDKDLRISKRNLDTILLDLIVYEDAQLVSEALSLLLRQHRQRIECAEYLCNVQLLCSKLQIAFLGRGKNLKKSLTRFKDSANKDKKEYTDVLKTLKDMIQTITIQAKDNDTVIDADVCRNRQELYKNIGVPQIMLEILKSLEVNTTTVELFNQSYKFLTLVCTGLEEMKEDLKRWGFEMFLAHLPAEVGSDALITELFSDNRKLCTQITPDDIKQFVNLIVTQGRSPRWLGFMNSLVVVRGLPIKKNQTQVIKELVANKTKTMLKNGTKVDPSLFVTQDDWKICHKLMSEYDPAADTKNPSTIALQYHVELVSLLCKCANGKNRAAEELCQQQLPQEAVIRGLQDPVTIPYVKKAYLEFLWESYIEVERRERKTQFDKEIWIAMGRMAQDLHECIDLQYDLDASDRGGHNYLENSLTDAEKKDKVQYLYGTVVWFLDSWFGGGNGPSYYEPDSWTNFGVEQSTKDEVAELCTRLLDGVCCLNDPNMPPIQLCEITTSLKDSVNVCVYRMMQRNIKPSKDKSPGGSEFSKLAEKLKEKGREFLENTDMYPPGTRPLTNEALTQKGLTMFARDFVQVIRGEELAAAASEKSATSEKGPLVKMLRELLDTGNENLKPYGDKRLDLYMPQKYIQKMVAEVVSVGCRDEDKPELLSLLQSMIDNPFPKANKAEQIDRQNKIRYHFCDSPIELPRLVIKLIAEIGTQPQTKGKGIFKAALQLTVAMVGSGFKPVQDKMLQLFQEDISEPSSKTEPFFSELESRLLTAKNECKLAKLHYQQQRDNAQAMLELEELEAAMFANAGQENAKEILKLTDPPPEKFPEQGYVQDIMRLIQQLCEDNNQAFKRFMQEQTGAPKIHDLVQKAVEYLEVWEKNKDEHNIGYGVCVFDALTELVIGPCRLNQGKIEEELKMETVNNILFATPNPVKLLSRGPSTSKQQVEAEVHAERQSELDTRELKQSCVLLLHSMLEGQKKGGRVLKKLEELNTRRIREDVIEIHKEQLRMSTTKYRLQVRLQGKPAFDAGLEALAFQMVVLVRRIHDANDDPKRPTPFMDTMLADYVATQGPQKPRHTHAEAKTAFRYFIENMGRIEISRDEPSDDAWLDRVYFQVPNECRLLTEDTKAALKAGIDRTSREDKLKQFVFDWTNKLGYEMSLQQWLTRSAVYRILDIYREHLKTFSFYLAIVINILILTGIDHEDKYDADPRAKVASTKGESTPYNILDFFEIEANQWVSYPVCEGFSFPCRDKVAYIPAKVNKMITMCGYAQTTCSSLNFFLFAMATGPMKIRDRWKTWHEAKEDDAKLADSNHDRRPFTASEIASLKRKYGPWYYVKSVYYLLTDGRVCYQIFYIACTVLGNLASIFFFCVHPLDILNRDNSLKSVLLAITTPIKTIFKTIVLSGFFIYVFTLLGFVVFHDHFNPGDAKQDNLCNSIAQCTLFFFYSGFISAEVWADVGLTDLWPKHPYGVQHAREMNDMRMFAARLFYDLFFFILIGVVLIGGVLFGVILDAFSEIRTSKQEKDKHQRSICFICEIDRDKFDKDGAGFNPHVKGVASDHNMWNYLFFIIYLRDYVEPEDYNGPESYVAEMLPLNMQPGEEPDVKWMPNGDALVLAGQSQGGFNTESDLSRRVEQLQDDLASIRKENELTSTAVTDLLNQLKHMEQNT